MFKESSSMKKNVEEVINDDLFVDFSFEQVLNFKAICHKFIEKYKDIVNNWKAPWVKYESNWINMYENIYSCNKCVLNEHRNIKYKYKVPGSFIRDNNTLPIFIVGDSPGYFDESCKYNIYNHEFGFPFAGKSGTVFENMCKYIGIDRNQAFITHCVKCSSKGKNLELLEKEKVDFCYNTCYNHLLNQLNLFKPVIIWCLGHAANYYICSKFLDEKDLIPDKTYVVGDKQILFLKKFIVVTSSHPAYIEKKDEYYFIKKEKEILDTLKVIVRCL